MDFSTDVILELSDIRQPFFVWRIRMEITIEIVPGDVIGIPVGFRTAFRPPLDRGHDVLLPADPEDALVIHIDPVVTGQFITDAAIAHVRMSSMNLPDGCPNLFIF